MPTHSVQKRLPYPAQNLFELVSNIENYANFLPWCEAARILENQGNEIRAELLIHYNVIQGRYTSRVTLNKEQKTISVELEEGPFEHLNNKWQFTESKDGTTIDFNIDFKMRSSFLEKIINSKFAKACDKVMTAFEAEAKKQFA